MPLPRPALLFLILAACLAPSPARAETPSVLQPNFLWITCEDMSPHLGCYGDDYARTPHIDRLASQSVRYSRAFATAPVCSAARSCLITGLYATSLGTQHLRSRFPIPDNLRAFPYYLRQHGYYCTNNAKTDYNTAAEDRLIREAWNESSPAAHWRGRQNGQPFFAVFNLMETHQSRANVWSADQFEREIGSRLSPSERHDPQRAPVPPYFPDTPTVRRTLARYYDCITAMDREVGRLLHELEADGLQGDTIVFFFSDHGMGMPRGKRTLYDSGLQVPLLIRFPEKFRHVAPGGPGSTSDRLVSFVDFPPTILSIAGIPIPASMQGTAFLGQGTSAPREYVFGARDRVDEAYDLSRSVRDAQFLYIRNYMPHLSLNQPEGYSDNAAMRREITRLAAQGTLNKAQWTYARPAKPVEELYDTQADPHQVHNLIGRSEYRDHAARLREALRRWQLESRDLGFLPEWEVRRRMNGRSPRAMGIDPEAYDIERVRAAADWVGRPNAADRQLEFLESSDSAVRFWGAVGLRASGTDTPAVRAVLKQRLQDGAVPVRIEAAGALTALGEGEAALPVLIALLQSKDWDAALHAARTLQLLGDRARPALPAMQRVLEQVTPRKEEDPHMYVWFSLEAAVRELARQGEATGGRL